MPYYGQQFPFWNFVSDFNGQGPNQHVPHPWFDQEGTEAGGPSHPHGPPPPGHHGPHGIPHHGPPPPPPPGHHGPPPPPDYEYNEEMDGYTDEKRKEQDPEKSGDKGKDKEDPKEPDEPKEPKEPGRGSCPRGRQCGGGRGGWGWGWGGPRGGHCGRGGRFGAHHRGPGSFPFGGPWGRRGGPFHGGHPFWSMNGNEVNIEGLRQFMQENFGFDITTGDNKKSAQNEDKDFAPAADIFETAEAYVIHVSLAGAKKEDLGVNWDPEKSEVGIAGVIHRPGDEAFLKTITSEERDVGVFERRIKLGGNPPPNVDADSITARMEDGVLIVTVPKVEEFVEVKKVDIQ